MKHKKSWWNSYDLKWAHDTHYLWTPSNCDCTLYELFKSWLVYPLANCTGVYDWSSILDADNRDLQCARLVSLSGTRRGWVPVETGLYLPSLKRQHMMSTMTPTLPWSIPIKEDKWFHQCSVKNGMTSSSLSIYIYALNLEYIFNLLSIQIHVYKKILGSIFQILNLSSTMYRHLFEIVEMQNINKHLEVLYNRKVSCVQYEYITTRSIFHIFFINNSKNNNANEFHSF